MELRPGYEKTEIGAIPDDWEVMPLKQVLTSYELGGNYPNTTALCDFPLMKMGNVSRGCFDLSKIEYVSGVTPSERHRLRGGDIIFNTRNTLDLVGKIAIWRDEVPIAYFNSNLMRMQFDPAVISSHHYANLTLNTEATLSRLRAMATGTTSVAAIYTRDLLGLPIVVPPRPEQTAIAEALSDVDASIAALSRLIGKKRNLRQGAMQRLLTGQTRLPGFTAPWQDKRLGEVANMQSGGTPPRGVGDYFGGGIPWVSISDMTSTGKYITSTTETLSSLGLSSSAARMFPSGTIMYAMYASLGEVCIATNPVSSSQAILGISTMKGVDVEFLYYSLLVRKSKVRLVGQQGTQSNLNKAMVQDFRIQLPCVDEQRAIATTLSDIEAAIAALDARLDKTRALKQAMMQALLTGRVRLPVRHDAAPQTKEAAHV